MSVCSTNMSPLQLAVVLTTETANDQSRLEAVYQQHPVALTIYPDKRFTFLTFNSVFRSIIVSNYSHEHSTYLAY